MTDTFTKYLFEVAPVVGVMGWWIFSLMKEKKSLVEDIRAKDALHAKEVDYNKARDKENLKTILETAAVLEALSTALSASETKFVTALHAKTDEVKNHIDFIGNQIQQRLTERRDTDEQ